VWDEELLFDDRIEAWAGGPVLPEIYRQHKGEFKVSEWTNGDPTKLSKDQEETVDEVLRFYGVQKAQFLSDLTHREDPWKIAREGMADMERGNREITVASMGEYYSGIHEKREE